jgi:hypothetical protein
MPSIDDAGELNANCADIETTMAILGCYARGRIHIFNVRDERIADAKYATSAHEMLHAAYARLTKNERVRINMLLEEAYQYSDRNNELRRIMAEYDRMEPERRYNELHSIFGTEYANLSPELEKHYARYFTDRSVIVDMSARYRKVFKDLETELDQLKVQMDRLAAIIEADLSLFETMVFWLNRDIEVFNIKEFHSLVEYNAERRILLEKERETESFVAQIEADIVRHNKLVEQYNNLGGRFNHLSYQIDSKLQTGVRNIKEPAKK